MSRDIVLYGPDDRPIVRRPLTASDARAMARRVAARYDAAQTTDENRKHWAAADSLSPNAALSADVRQTVRNRARYEVANNSYAAGIVQTLANDTVGTGPRLQMMSPAAEANRELEDLFNEWSSAINLPEKLRTMRQSRAESGECFLLFATNDDLDFPVKLDVLPIEADRVESPMGVVLDPSVTDGIRHNSYGTPLAYYLLRNHPGDVRQVGISSDGDWVTAKQLLHYFKPTRPGQARGLPDITPALPLFAMLRRYTLAVLAAAETAADFAAVLYTDAPANGEAEEVDPMDVVNLERRMATTLPAGWKLGQMAAEQPSTTYEMFKHELLNEISRCLNMPFNIAAGNSAGYNYSSGRLDHQTYFRAIRIDQSQIERGILRPILAAWILEATLVEGLIPQAFRERGRMPRHQWFWDGFEHVDPAKEAQAQAMRLQNHTTTLAIEYARQGLDWESELRQRALEMKLMKELGIASAPAQQTQEAQNANEDDEDDEGDGDEAPARRDRADGNRRR